MAAWERVVGGRTVILLGAIVATLSGCVSAQPDVAHLPVVLRPPWDQLPPAPPGATVQPGSPVVLTPLQQEAVVSGVMPFMKDGPSVRFGTLRAARNGQGVVTVCGEVDGRDGAGLVVPAARPASCPSSACCPRHRPARRGAAIP
jgi:hypothetical protein